MLSCWCITWPVGFERLKHTHWVYWRTRITFWDVTPRVYLFIYLFTYLFVVYLTPYQKLTGLQCPMLGWFTKGRGRNRLWDNSKYYRGLCLEGLKKKPRTSQKSVFLPGNSQIHARNATARAGLLVVTLCNYVGRYSDIVKMSTTVSYNSTDLQ